MNRGFRRMRLMAVMIWRRWIPTGEEELVRAERLAAWSALVQQQHHAAAAFRWRLVEQRSKSSTWRRSSV